MAKKRRTELDVDIDTPIVEEKPPEPEIAAPPPPVEEAPPEPEPTSKISRTKLMIISGVALLLITLTSAIGYGVYSWLTPEPAPTAKPAVKAPDVKRKPPPRPVRKTMKPQVKPPKLFQFDSFLIPVGEGEKERFVRVDFAVEMSDDKVRKEIERNLVIIRENVYEELISQNLATFMDKEKMDKVKVEVAIIVNRSIQSGAVAKTFLTGLTIN